MCGLPKFTPCMFRMCSTFLGVPHIGHWISRASNNEPHFGFKHNTNWCCGFGTPGMIFSGPPAGLVSPSGSLPENVGNTGGCCGGSGVAVPCGENANIDRGGEIAGDADVPFLSGVNMLYCSSFPAPNDGCFAPSCRSGVGASGTFRIGDNVVDGKTSGGKTTPPLHCPGF